MNTDDIIREELSHEADAARSRLLRTVTRIDRRWHEAFNWRTQLRRHLREVVIVGGTLMLGIAGAVVVSVVHKSAQRRARSRAGSALEAWRHPEQATLRQPRSFVADVVRSVLFTIVTTALSFPARRAVAILMQARTVAAARRSR